MSKPLAILSALATAGILAAGAGFYFAGNVSSDIHFIGENAPPSQVFYPDASHKESRIGRLTAADGTAFDNVDMRDGRTKQLSLDDTQKMQHVDVFYAGQTPGQPGPLQYEKTHNSEGHLVAERHLRKDGSLEMDGRLNGSIYVRRLFYPDLSNDPNKLVIASLETFDLAWQPIDQRDFRLDRTLAMLHTWKNYEETKTHYDTDGATILMVESNKNGGYYQELFYPDNGGVRVSEQNGGGGTVYQLFDKSHALTMKLVFSNTRIDDFYLYDPDRSEWHETWVEDWSKDPIKGDLPRWLVKVDHSRPDGKTDGQYSFDRDGTLKSATIIRSNSRLGTRSEYAIGKDGYATSVQVYNEQNMPESKSDLSRADNIRFDLPAAVLTRPNPELPPVKEGFLLYGQPPQEGPH